MNVGMNIFVKKLHEDAVIPDFAHPSDAGLDVASVEEVLIPAKGYAKVPIGIAIQMMPLLCENKNYLNCKMEVQVRPRSGLAFKHGITAFLGTIDQNYRGEIGVLLFNHSEEDYTVVKGERVAQLVPTILPIAIVTETLVELDKTDRGENGFGSSGTI